MRSYAHQRRSRSRHATLAALLLVCIAVTLGARADAETVHLVNPSFTEAIDRPTHWGFVFYGRHAVEAFRDTDVFHSAPSSLTIRSVHGAAQGTVYQKLGRLSGEVTVRGFARAVGKEFAKAEVVLHTMRADRLQRNWLVLCTIPQDGEWHRFETTLTMPRWSDLCSLVLNIDGDGQLWLDDVSMANADGQELPPAQQIANGSMTESTLHTRGWDRVWGNVAVVYDTEVHHSAPASLSLRAVGGPVNGTVYQPFAGVTRPVIVTGYARATGPDIHSAEVVLNSHAKHNLKRERQVVFRIPTDGEWHAFSTRVVIPDFAVDNSLLFALQGDGRIWIDDVQITIAAE